MMRVYCVLFVAALAGCLPGVKIIGGPSDMSTSQTDAAPMSGDMGSGKGDMATAGTDMAMGKAESVTLTFTTAPAKSGFGTNNVVAVWIESADGSFVKTVGRWADVRKGNLLGWVAKAGNADVDAVTGATNANYGVLTAKWDMTARAGGTKPVDGTYNIRMELADSNAATVADNNEGTFSFTRNGVAAKQTALTNGKFSSVTVDYSGR